MSWFARSIANSLRLEDDDDDEDTNPNFSSKVKDSVSGNKVEDEQKHDQMDSSPLSPSEGEQGRGVKEDLSELTKTLTRQFWGVASFLAPPPSEISDSTRSQPSDQISDSNHESQDPQVSDLDAISGIRSDLSEIGGKFKTGISKLSSNKAVSEITKIASNFLQFGPDQDGSSGDAVGVTEEVLAFARNIALHPETWLDFPLPDDEDSDDFDMSDAQQEHALAVERLAPELAALRFELCPGYMSEDCFWKIYFVLLHPRLDKQDAELLSTPQIVEARAMLTQELQNRRKGQPEPDWSGGDSTNLKEIAPLSHNEHLSVPSAAQSDSVFSKTSAAKSATIAGEADFETQKNQDPNTGIKIIDKSVVEKDDNSASTFSSRVLEDKYEDDGDDWLKEENLEVGGNGGTTIPIANDEDVSFSDLEEDDGDVPTSHKKVAYTSDSSNKDAREWVQLSRSSTDSAKEIESVDGKQVRSRDSETKESNDWLDVDDIDVM